MNECIDSTMGLIPVYLLCCFLVTIRELVGSSTQSQAPDIPGASSRAVFLRHTAPLPAQSKAPDSYALCVYTEELLVSLNVQTQAPYNPSQALLDYHMLSLRAYMEILLASSRSKLLMIFSPNIISGIHVFPSKFFAISVKNLQG